MSKAKRAAPRAGEATEEIEMPEGLQGQVSVALPNFEGPLDLLLHLCQKHELDILDIPIHFVTEKYLEFLSVMTLMNLDVASEYLVMAATLAHIKSKMLLPTPPADQDDDADLEEIDPREALIKRLLEYQKYKHAAAALLDRGIAGKDVFFRGVEIEEAVHTGLPPLAEIPLFSLVEAFQHVLSKTKVQITHDVVADRISITDRINELVDVLHSHKRVLFEDLFAGLTTKFDLVITFLALLEMSRLRMTRLYQSEPLAPLYVEPALGDGEGIPDRIPDDAMHVGDAAFAPPEPSLEIPTDMPELSPNDMGEGDDELDAELEAELGSRDEESIEEGAFEAAREASDSESASNDAEMELEAATDDVAAPATHAVDEDAVEGREPHEESNEVGNVTDEEAS